MKSKKTILAAVVASVVASASSYAKSGAYIGLSGVGALDDSFVNLPAQGTSAIGNMSTVTLGGGPEVGYNVKFNDFSLGVGLLYIYAAPNFKYVAKDDKGDVTTLS